MKNFSTWILVMFMAMFWAFRIIVAVTAEMRIDFAIQPFNITLEIILLFVVLLCMLLIIKRKLIGALIYLLAYGMYFGTDMITGMTSLFSQASDISITGMDVYLNSFVSLIGIIIPVAVLLDLLMDKSRKANPKDKKTDWFYKNEKFDRQMDERADKNNYRTL